jgi:hypothetical protein
MIYSPVFFFLCFSFFSRFIFTAEKIQKSSPALFFTRPPVPGSPASFARFVARCVVPFFTRFAAFARSSSSSVSPKMHSVA